MNKNGWVSVAQTDVGTVRKANEDSYFESSNSEIWCVADGMGGHARGDVASQMITQDLSELVKESKNTVLIENVVSCIRAVNTKLVALSKQKQSIVGSTVALYYSRIIKRIVSGLEIVEFIVFEKVEFNVLHVIIVKLKR
jgi:serine/threonine protein phosphatase PrpC